MPLTGDRNTKTATSGLRSFPAAAGVVVYEGALVALDTSGNARPGRASTTDIAVGRAVARADNTGGLAGAVRVTVDCDSIAFYANSTSGDLIATTDIGATCYVVDDGQVAKTNGTNTRIAAGLIHDVTSDGVAVRFVK